MNAGYVLRRARTRAGLSTRELARRAGTSHAAVVAYEAGRKSPTVDTFDRLLRACGFVLEGDLVPAPAPDRGEELAEALDLAARFPARHARTLRYPRFGAA